MKIDLLDNPASEDVRIEIIPLVDVIFCILTFFILAAVGSTRQQAIELALPSASTGSPLPAPSLGEAAIRQENLFVSLDAIGQVYLDKQPVTLDWLYDVILRHQQVSPEGVVVLYASKDARYEEVLGFFDLLRSVAGVDRVTLGIVPRENSNPANAISGDDLLDPSLLQDPTLTPSPGTDPLLDPLAPPVPGSDPWLDPLTPLDE